MKVTFLNTFEQHGGAGLAGYRLFQSLKKNTSTDLVYLSQFKGEFKKFGLKNWSALARIGFEKLELKSKIRNPSDLYKFETGKYGKNISHDKDIMTADLVHLHWVNQGFLSLKTIQELAGIKPVVWTMHDMWPFTGGCSYSNECSHFRDRCGNCPFLIPVGKEDLSSRIWDHKLQIYKSGKITLVGPSQWIARKAKESSLGKFTEVFQIPNPIDTEFFTPGDRYNARKNVGIEEGKIVLLFGAQNIDDERKGFHTLLKSLKIIRQLNPSVADKITLVVFGDTHNAENLKDQPVNIHYAGVLRNPGELKQLYNAANWYIHPAIIDNLPNTVVESITCGTPVIGFDTGGVKEIIKDGFNGILANIPDAEELSKRIIIAIESPAYEITYGKNARNFAVENFSMEKVASRYLEIYKQILERKNA